MTCGHACGQWFGREDREKEAGAAREPTTPYPDQVHSPRPSHPGFSVLISVCPSTFSHCPPASLLLLPAPSSPQPCIWRPGAQHVASLLQSSLPPVGTSPAPTYRLSPILTQPTSGLVPTADGAKVCGTQQVQAHFDLRSQPCIALPAPLLQSFISAKGGCILPAALAKALQQV